MGQAKSWAMEQASQGFYSKDTRVCTHCIDDDALRAYIKQTGEVGHLCSYCDADDQGNETVCFDDFIQCVLAGIESEWDDPNNEGVGWEGDWAGEVQDSYDLLTEELDIGFRNATLFDDVRHSLSDRQWCQKNFYELETHHALTSGWKEFINIVKHESRYVFFRREDSRAKWRGSEEIPPSDFLDALGQVISHCRLYAKLKAGSMLSRLRVHSPEQNFTKAHELSSPPPEAAIYPNRMSAAGITAFYGAFDKETAIAETAPAFTQPMAGTLGQFKLLKDLHVVDFTNLPLMPSIFEPKSHDLRHSILFLRHFLKDFTAPVEKDGMEHIEYVPTQIVAEYLKFIHLGPEGRPIDGILYKSARRTGANACVLFIGSDCASDPGDYDEKKVVMLEQFEKFMLPVQ